MPSNLPITLDESIIIGEVARLREWIRFVDSRVDVVNKLYKENTQVKLPGYQQDMIVDETIDNVEFEVGVGFVVCQRFLTSIYGLYGLDKKKALNAGPAYCDNYSKAELVNHAANYWKHRDEWDKNNNKNRENKIKEALKSVGADENCDPLMKMLTEISPNNEPRFESLVDELEKWSDDVKQQRNQSSQ